MTAVALLIDPATGDIDVSRHRFRLTPDLKTYVAQRIEQRCKLCLGEWFLNVRKGVPFFRDILIKNPDMDLIQSIFAAVILNTNGVAQLTEYSQTLDVATRALSIRFSCTLTTGQVLPNQSIDIPF